eukprot:8183055-Pyramimonas_sp.AAC.1
MRLTSARLCDGPQRPADWNSSGNAPRQCQCHQGPQDRTSCRRAVRTRISRPFYKKSALSRRSR